MVEQAKLIVNGKEYTVERILKDVTNLPKMEYENEDLMPLSVEEIENYAMGL